MRTGSRDRQTDRDTDTDDPLYDESIFTNLPPCCNLLVNLKPMLTRMSRPFPVRQSSKALLSDTCSQPRTSQAMLSALTLYPSIHPSPLGASVLCF
jgi:hypothetical protein